jgi:hypothetical protein
MQVCRRVGVMDRNTTIEHLELTRRHIAQSERHIAHQHEIIAEQQRNGHDTARPKELLYQLEELKRLQVADRDRVEKELAQTSE